MRRGCWVAEFRLESERLVLRSWRAEDLAPFHAICADPLVLETLMSFKRAGATGVLTYHALHAARLING